VLDPGRPARRRDPRSPSYVSLPPELAARFRVDRELSPGGAQADLYVVREHATGQELVLKLYLGGWRPDQRIWDYLRSGRRSRSVVDTFETGTADGRCYEIMEHLAGGDLMALRERRNLDELGADGVKEIVRQLAEALDDMHANNIVHRDIKPTNILIRSIDRLELAVVDLGISSVVGPEGDLADERNGTPPYVPPEFIVAQRFSRASDWWALGVSLIEFITNRSLFEGLDDPVAMKIRLTSGPISLSAVTDPRLRLLCRGLTAQAERNRWGSKQVREWLAGGAPPAPEYQPPESERPGAAAQPFVYRGNSYRFADELAAAMTESWETAATVFYGEDREPRRRLREWLRQFPDIRPPAERRLSRRPDPANVRLLRMLRAMDPAHPPVYRNVNVTVGGLPELAQRAIGNVGNYAPIVAELFRYDLLPLLATGAPAPGLGGGDGLAGVQSRWSDEREWFARIAPTVTDDDARAELERLQREEPNRLIALGLLAATTTTENRATVQREVIACDRDVELPWFSELAARPDAMWVAYALIPFATNTADRLFFQAEQERLEREWLARTQALREWSRRQNRPQALAWGVAGVVALATVWVLMVGLSDIVDVSSDATVVDAWFATVASLLVVLAAESLLAWQIGGGFHPRYSMLGSGIITIGRLARSVAGRGITLPVLLGILGAGAVLSVFVPVITPIVTAAVIAVWTVARFDRWRTDRAREQASIEQAEQERRSANA
jgi:serine/threonine protein kinase